MQPFTTCPHNKRNKEARLLAVSNAIEIMQIHLDALKKSLECPELSALFFEQAKAKLLGVTRRCSGGPLPKGKTYIIGDRSQVTELPKRKAITIKVK